MPKNITQKVVLLISKFHISILGIANNIQNINTIQNALGGDNISFLLNTNEIIHISTKHKNNKNNKLSLLFI